MSQSQALVPLEGPGTNAEGPWSRGVRLLLPCPEGSGCFLPRPPSLPGAGAGGQPQLTNFRRSPGRVASPRHRTQQACAPTWSGEGQGQRRAGQASGHFPPSRATQGPYLREKENILLFFSSFFPVAPASLTHCLAASRGTGVLQFLRTLGRNHRGQGQRKQSTAVARALPS